MAFYTTKPAFERLSAHKASVWDFPGSVFLSKISFCKASETVNIFSALGFPNHGLQTRKIA
jgi:hypothetical protein